MDEYNELQVSQWLRDGIAAARAGRRAEARELLLRVVEANEESEQAWLWLSGVVDSDEDRLIALENVLALNPDNAQALAGIKWMQGQIQSSERGGMEGASQPQVESSARPYREELALTPDGCAYCARPVPETAARCPYCGGRLVEKRFKTEERSALSYMLHAFWLILAAINLADYFLIGLIWHNDRIPATLHDYLPYVVGRGVTGDIGLSAPLDPDLQVQIARYVLVGLAALGALDALGLFLRRPLAHTLGIVLIALHLLIGLALFVLGFLGYFMVAVRGVITVILTSFLFNTVEEFTKDTLRERLEPDRHVRNDADYYVRGRVYEKKGMWAKALLHWRKAAALNPQRDVYFASLARAYAHLGWYDQALTEIDAAIRIGRTPQEWQPLREIIIEAQQRAGMN
jgi:tetratricopeptide (TPR) repeat protein